MAVPRKSRRAVETLLNAGLASLRQGAARDLTNRHRRLREALHRAWLDAILGSMGDALAPDERSPEAVRILLTWAVARLRPDRRDSLADIDETAWLHSTSWRPMLTLACHHGLLAIPAFPQRYRRRQDEAALENLCGIWAVGPSTVYRYLDKARRQLTDLLSPGAASGADRMNLRRAVLTTLRARVPSSHTWEDWHRQQGRAALLNGQVQDALWHFHNAGEVEKVLDVLRRSGAESAASDETDELLATLENGDRLTPPQRIELQLQWAALWRLRSEQARAEEALGRALRQAEHLGEPLYIGMAQASLGHHLEERDRDRAIGMFEDSLRWLRRSIEEGSDAHRLRAVDEYAQCVVHLAWLHLRRNNPKARTLLDQVAQLQASTPLDDRTVGSLEQAWGEYWRCAGNPQRALEHKHRALTIYQRLGDHRSVLNALRNLSLIYSDAKDFDRAIQYGQQVIDAARTQTLEPEVLAGAHGNIGIAYFFKEQFDRAIEHYLQALALQNQAGLRAQLIAVHYNLAEAYYELFKRDGKRQDEEQGDIHAATAARLSTEDNAHAQADAARSLKREVIGTGEGPDRLLPTEHAAHFSEMAEIERLRLSLALPQGAEQQVRTHLAIARAYLSIATKEREAAVAIANRHGLQTADFQIELETLRATFSRELTREQQLDQDWHGRSGDLLAKERRQSVLAYVLAQGSINKSAYAEAAAVSLATASKHLGLLAERGLLVQTGKGPSTRYLLPSQ